jgi:propionyl-CoA carboxylase alpha chain
MARKFGTPSMFSKILIANRGEIACRVIRTARKMGIATVAIYSAADRDALHVEMADEAVPIGPAPSVDSYLAIDRVVDAVRSTGSEAVHPGYGFLAENQRFARAVEAAGAAFIGPNVEAIAAMGDKIESKRLAQAAGVSVVPGHVDTVGDDQAAIAIARDMGYPVMIKASAGGGGKGMRIAWDDEEVRQGYRSARNEARSSFADDRVFIEKYIEEPRHIEIQVLADTHGNTIHLGERECSIQRRHQKVIEEAPSPFIDRATRESMGAQAVTLAKAVDYRSAGTVEFIVGPDRNFYFLEMNTRLQVEHPVTECITGLDLVELMIRVAAGEKLPLAQDDITLDGWALECRVYAEDPRRNFMPSIGRIVRYAEPPPDTGVRVDSGVYEGGEVSLYYDPMVAKVVTHGADRTEAIDRMRSALDAFYLRGVEHNMDFLNALIRHPRFAAGRLSTDFIAEEYPDGFAGREIDKGDFERLVVLAAALHRREVERSVPVSSRLDGRDRLVGDEWVVIADDVRKAVRAVPGDGTVEISLDGTIFEVVGHWRAGRPLFRGSVNGEPICVQVDRHGLGYRLASGGIAITAWVLTPRAAELFDFMPATALADTSKLVLSPMPGLLVSLAVEVGQEIKVGEEMAIVEAMKMENVLRAERDGVIKALHAAPGDSLAADQTIAEFE